jgi:hypothetical protein
MNNVVDVNSLFSGAGRDVLNLEGLSVLGDEQSQRSAQ